MQDVNTGETGGWSVLKEYVGTLLLFYKPKQIKSILLKQLMHIVSSAYGMHSIFRQSYQNSLDYGRRKNIKTKGKALHPPAQVISV